MMGGSPSMILLFMGPVELSNASFFYVARRAAKSAGTPRRWTMAVATRLFQNSARPVLFCVLLFKTGG